MLATTGSVVLLVCVAFAAPTLFVRHVLLRAGLRAAWTDALRFMIAGTLCLIALVVLLAGVALLGFQPRALELNAAGGVFKLAALTALSFGSASRLTHPRLGFARGAVTGLGGVGLWFAAIAVLTALCGLQSVYGA